MAARAFSVRELVGEGCGPPFGLGTVGSAEIAANAVNASEINANAVGLTTTNRSTGAQTDSNPGVNAVFEEKSGATSYHVLQTGTGFDYDLGCYLTGVATSLQDDSVNCVVGYICF